MRGLIGNMDGQAETPEGFFWELTDERHAQHALAYRDELRERMASFSVIGFDVPNLGSGIIWNRAA